TRRLAVQESVRPASVEAQHPVPDDLKPDAADLGRLGARRTVIDRRKRQKPPGLRTVVGSPGQTAQLRRIKIPAYGNRSRHDEPPWFATLNLTRPHRAIAQESRFQGLGIRGVGVGVDTRIVRGERLHLVEAVFDRISRRLVAEMPLARKVCRIAVLLEEL